MTPRDGESPMQLHPAGVAAGYAGAPQAAGYAMRPLSLGELLDRTFTVYRSRFWLFAGLGAVAALLQTGISAAQLAPMHLASMAGAFDPAKAKANAAALPFPPNYLAGIGAGAVVAFVVVMALYLLVFVVTQAATVFALGEVYLGKPTTILASLKATVGKWYRYLGVGMWQAWSMLWIPAIALLAGAIFVATKIEALKIVGGLLIFLGIAGGLPLGIYFWLKNSLGVQATVMEALTVRASMKRSKVLTVGAKGRVFVLLLLAGALSYAASLLQMPLMLFVMFTVIRGGRAVATEIVMLLVGFVGHAVVQPVLMIGLSLLYFDQRVRQEGFDLVMLLGPEDAGQAGPAGWATPQGVVAAVAPAVPMEEVLRPRMDDEQLS